MKTQMMIAKSIETALFQRGISREDFAKRIGMSPTSMYRKINGLSDFRTKEVETIAKALGFSGIWDFFEYVKSVEEIEKKMPAVAATGDKQ